MEEEEYGDLSRYDLPKAELSDACSSVQFQANMVLPNPKAIIEEPDIELDIIDA